MFHNLKKKKCFEDIIHSLWSDTGVTIHSIKLWELQKAGFSFTD